MTVKDYRLLPRRARARVDAWMRAEGICRDNVFEIEVVDESTVRLGVYLRDDAGRRYLLRDRITVAHDSVELPVLSLPPPEAFTDLDG